MTAMQPTTVFIDGIGFWSPTLPGWDAAATALQRGATPGTAQTRPLATMLGANERRRAPDSVLLALQVAGEALSGSGHEAVDVATVFASAHGDLPITDALCRTLAENPLLLSPTRFHHSVHNAASGYWAIGSGSHAASTALAAGEFSFAAGLLEACCLCAADGAPTMLVAYDTEACGPLMSVNRSRGMLALALVLAPRATAASRWSLQCSHRAGAGEQSVRAAAARALADNATAPGLPLFEALAAGRGAVLRLPLAAQHHLSLALQPMSSRRVAEAG